MSHIVFIYYQYFQKDVSGQDRQAKVDHQVDISVNISET